MKTVRLRSQVLIAADIDEVFSFFADAGNLDLLTPEWLRIRILTPQPIRMEPGVEIDYRLRIRGVPVGWRSRITAWDPPHSFIDEQIRGPYRQWIHQHRFSYSPEGTRVEDWVEYAVWGGSLVDRFLVAPDLDRIFEYRTARLVEQFQSDNGNRVPQ